jgi:formylglycine-generating enzyme required for sulfatase activity
VGLVSAHRLLAAAAALASACSPSVDYSGTTYRCSDGHSCPDGFTCVALVCREGDLSDATPGPADAAAADAPAVPEAPMVAIPMGSFLRGCNFVGDPSCAIDAIPQATITLSAYQIDVHEVTQAAYAVCVDAGHCVPPAARFEPGTHPDAPVTDVSWEQADAYCRDLGKRLPSEAEWERAARGEDGRTYPWGESVPECARVVFTGCATAPLDVATRVGDASPFGLRDLAGNVAEWVNDRYSPSYYANGSPDVDPPGPATGADRVIRGGGFDADALGVRTFVRDHAGPGTTRASLGFRCAR